MPQDPVVVGIRITHPDRVVYRDVPLTKLDLVRYYEAVAAKMLPHLRDRPLTLVQCAPDANHCRYLRHSGQRAPAQVRVVEIQEQTKAGDYMVIDDAPGLIALAQRNIVELHTWNAPMRHLERPDRIVFDLDPGPEVPWRDMVDAARLLRDTLEGLALDSWLKTTGGMGLHIVVPLKPANEWSTCVEFARTVAETLADHDPARFTIKFAKRGRERQILVDYLRNNRSNTSVAAYSARARPHATVSMPLAWDELTPGLRPERWTVRTALRRVNGAADPWAAYFRSKQALPAKAVDVRQPVSRTRGSRRRR